MNTNIKTGEQIEEQLKVSRDIMRGNPGIKDNLVEKHTKEKWVPLDEFNECFDLLFEMVYQACAVHPYGVEDCLDSMALRTNVDAMKYLAKHGKLKITKEGGRRVFATVEG